jgi:hypothetical protein
LGEKIVLHALTVASLVFGLGADTAQEEAKKKDLENFQGTWTVVSMEMDGKPRHENS